LSDEVLETTMDCSTFRRSIHHFQADELSAAERAAVESHLDNCAACARALEVEEGFLRGLRSRRPRAEAPSGLEARVRAALAREAPDPAPSAWYRGPWLAAAAAALLLALLLVPGLGRPREGGWSPAAGVVPVTGVEVMIVDLECDRAGMSIEQQRNCRARHHINALKTADGRYWHISPDQADYGKMIADPQIRGRRLVVDGDYYPGINTLRITFSRSAAVAVL
jgi:anti-sigma factor RsiW